MNINKLMKQAKKMQNQMMKQQEELESKEYEASSGGGMVKVRMTGKFELVAIDIKPEAVDPDDVEILQDMVKAAVNECVRTAKEESQKLLESLTGGMPGLPGF